MNKKKNTYVQVYQIYNLETLGLGFKTPRGQKKVVLVLVLKKSIVYIFAEES